MAGGRLKSKSKRKTQPKMNSRRAIRSDVASARDAISATYCRTKAVLFAGVGLILLLVVLYIIVYPVGGDAVGNRQSQQSARHLTFLAVNDIYRLDGIAEGKIGGLTRVRTLRTWIERDAPNAILLHAGDLLSPSLASKVFKGEQMIDVLNNLDGDAKAFDSRMFVAFGNHEFDDSVCNKPEAVLNARVDESQFSWLAANLDFPKCSSMKGILNRKNVHKDGVVIEVNKVKVGLFGIGLTPDKESAPKYPPFEEALPAARRSIDYLRGNGAEFIVALTHLPREDDEALLKEFSAAGLDLVAGGHDHTNMVLQDAQGQARGFKADSDARTAWRIDVQVPPGGKPRIEAQLIALNEAIPADAGLSRLAQVWSDRAEAALCAKRAKDKGEPVKPNCLHEEIGRTQSMIELEETANRSQETGFGDWLADLMLAEGKADVAIINSGILGLNEDLAPGRKLLLRHVVDIFRFDDVVAVRPFPAKQVCAAIRHGLISPGTGAWPHLGGVEVEVKRSQGKYLDAAVKRFTKKPDVTCDSNAPIMVAAVPFLLCSGDGYALLPRTGECEEAVRKDPYGNGEKKQWPKLGDLSENAIRAAGDAGIKLATEKPTGRVRFIDVGAK